MNKTSLLKEAILVLSASTLSACLLVPVDDGNGRGGGYNERDRGGDHRGHNGNNYDHR